MAIFYAVEAALPDSSGRLVQVWFAGEPELDRLGHAKRRVHIWKTEPFRQFAECQLAVFISNFIRPSGPETMASQHLPGQKRSMPDSLKVSLPPARWQDDHGANPYCRDGQE